LSNRKEYSRFYRLGSTLRIESQGIRRAEDPDRSKELLLSSSLVQPIFPEFLDESFEPLHLKS
jgi:hypothetical protein